MALVHTIQDQSIQYIFNNRTSKTKANKKKLGKLKKEDRRIEKSKRRTVLKKFL